VEKKFTVLRIIGTLWKIIAWISLVVGVIGSVGVLLTGILGGSIMQQVVPVPEGASWVYGVAGGITGFVATLIATIAYFLLMYAVGELIYLLLAIEENTRQASQQIQRMAEEASEPEPIYAPPADSYSTPPSYSAPPPQYAPPAASYSAPPPAPVPAAPEDGATQAEATDQM